MELSTEILNELRIIKWLLAALVVMSFFVVLIFFRIGSTLTRNQDIIEKQRRKQNNIREFDELLQTGHANDVKHLSRNWISLDSDEPYAYWYLAKAYYHLGEKVNAKKNFIRTIEVDPEWDKAVNEWLEKIEDELAASRPESVK
ncbi:MAG: hypothetical protein OEY43_03230 [Gammaproteobacteria bacterium]|nr:hypothetical protein [Gammaproteobacteria bacterium]